MSIKCAAEGCTNRDSQGAFVGAFCMACHQALRRGDFSNQTNAAWGKLYTDHAAEVVTLQKRVAELEEERKAFFVGGQPLAELRDDRDSARQERDSLLAQLEASRREAMEEGNEKRAYEAHYLNECNRTKALTAQLEAAKGETSIDGERREMDKMFQDAGIQLTAQLEAAKREASGSYEREGALLRRVDAAEAQLTAQPDVLRDIAALPVDSDSSAKAVSLAKVALGLPMPTYKSVAEMERALTAQPGGKREGWKLSAEQVHDTVWDHLPGLQKNSKEANALLELERMALAALHTAPEAKETKP